MKTKRHSLGAEAYEKLRRLLIHGQLQSGVKLIESEWAKRLGVHRIAMREAMVLLAHEGLLKPGPRGGFCTPILEQRDLDEVLEVRALIEIGAIRLIGARKPDRAGFKKLESICDLMQANLDAGMELGFLEADRAFHRALVEFSGNQRLLDLYSHAPLPLLAVARRESPRRHADCMCTIAEHRRICELIAAGEINDAIDVTEKHLRASRPAATLYSHVDK